MMPGDRRPHTLFSDRNCPVCGEPVRWSRYWLRAVYYAVWVCPRCETLLGFDRKWWWLWTITAVVAGLVWLVLRWPYSVVGAVAVYVAGCAGLGSFDRVKVLGIRNSQYCPSCRYDLSGTLAAGIGKCPECGRAVDAERRHD